MSSMSSMRNRAVFRSRARTFGSVARSAVKRARVARERTRAARGRKGKNPVIEARSAGSAASRRATIWGEASLRVPLFPGRDDHRPSPWCLHLGSCDAIATGRAATATRARLPVVGRGGAVGAEARAAARLVRSDVPRHATPRFLSAGGAPEISRL